MANTHTGPNRLKGGLQRQAGRSATRPAPGRCWAPWQAGYNDIGILTAPDGKELCGRGDDQADLDPAADAHGADEQCRAGGDRAARHEPRGRPTAADVPTAAERLASKRRACSACRRVSSSCSSSAGFPRSATCAALIERIDDKRRPSRSPTTSASPTSGRARPAISTAATRWSPRSIARSPICSDLPLDRERAAAGPALRARPGVQAAHRHVRAGRIRFLRPHRRARAAHLDGDDLSEPSRGWRRDALQD
jgi:hypothetical protein